MKISAIIKRTAVAAAVALVALTAAADDLHREHRAIWMSPFLGSNWPSSSIVQGNSEALKRNLRTRLDKFQSDGINVLYYHVRSFCDANYNSKYEPWSNQVSTARGVAPAFDPFEYLIEQAHLRGIEVYGWVNPYRYCNYSGWGAGELNYENSHPEWLLRTPNQIILNPGLPEVVQRICDVVEDIVTNFDVDGIIFDDYFYSNPTGLEYDADLYNAYVAQGGKLSQLDWRRDNVNRMVSSVNATIKAAKPWVVFGISPAGTSSPVGVEETYGLPPGPYGDWQYNGIASDPLAWLKAHSIDFISPQIYWPNRWKGLNDWWSAAAKKFGRHFYPSTDLSDFNEYRTQTFIDQIDYQRGVSLTDQGGYVFFQYGTYVNGSSENISGTRLSFGENLANTVFQNRALTPLRYWDGAVRRPAAVTGLTLSGDRLTWTEVPGMRYAVYAIPAEVAVKAALPEYLAAVVPSGSYTIPAEKAGCTFAVAVYDRFGNEYAPMTPGGSVAADQAATLVSPASGKAPALFDFRWQGSSQRYLLEVATDADFTDLLARIETSATSVNASQIPQLEKGVKYYWRVMSWSLDRTEAVSPTGEFELSSLEVLAPVAGAKGVELMPTISWTAAEEGSHYTLEVSRDKNFFANTLTYTTDETSLQIPDFQLISGRLYYVRVTAENGGATVTSDATTFSTLDVPGYDAPTFAAPAASGETLFSNQCVTLNPWRGMYSCTVSISETDAFPSRSSYNSTLTSFATTTPELGTIKVGSKALADGKTYYVRVRGTYYLNGESSAQYTEYSPVTTFVYSSETGVADAVAAEGLRVDAECILHCSAPTEVYGLSGQLLFVAADGASLAHLPAGVYLLRSAGNALKWLK